MVVVDTSEVFAGLEGEGDTANRKSLEQVARLLDLHPQFMHNAGNDAHVRSEGCQDLYLYLRIFQYTMLALKEMAGGEQLDMQREQRWPKKTGATAESSVKVQWEDWELDPEYEDTQAVLDSLAASGKGYDPYTGQLMEDDESDYD